MKKIFISLSVNQTFGLSGQKCDATQSVSEFVLVMFFSGSVVYKKQYRN